MAQQKIRIRLKGEHTQLDRSADRSSRRRSGRATSPAPCPCRPSGTSTASSAVPSRTRTPPEHFEVRTHKRLIDIHSPTPKTVDSLMRLDLPAGVDIEIKL